MKLKIVHICKQLGHKGICVINKCYAVIHVGSVPVTQGRDGGSCWGGDSRDGAEGTFTFGEYFGPRARLSSPLDLLRFGVEKTFQSPSLWQTKTKRFLESTYSKSTE